MKKTTQFKKSRWLPAYLKPPGLTERGKTTFNETRHKSGVYLIKKDGAIVYVGHSTSQLYKTLYRHFQAWNHPFQKVISYRGQDLARFRVRVILCAKSRAEDLESYLIKKLKPTDNPDKLESLLELTPAMERAGKAAISAPVEQVDIDTPF